MLTREHLRLKTFQVLYSHFQAENPSLANSEKELEKAIDGVYDVYVLYLLLLEQLLHHSRLRMERAKMKKLPRPEDLQPNLKFINNPLLNQLSYNLSLALVAKKRRLNLSAEYILLQGVYQSMTTSVAYQQYMSTPTSTYEEEKRDLIKIFRQSIINYSGFHQWLKKRSVYAQLDDIDRVCSILIKTLKEFKEVGENIIYPPYKPEYRDFFSVLLRKTVAHSDWIEEILKTKAENWEIERFAPVDMILIKMAITEAVEFPSIPANVTMDEYIEFAKNYSTEKSGAFINGILEKVFEALIAQGKMKKQLVKTELKEPKEKKPKKNKKEAAEITEEASEKLVLDNE